MRGRLCLTAGREHKWVAASNAGKFVVAKVNTEGLPYMAERFHIASLPTLVLFTSGSEMARIEGARTARQIQRFVEQSMRAVQALRDTRYDVGPNGFDTTDVSL